MIVKRLLGPLGAALVLSLAAVSIAPPALAQKYTVNLKETDIQELIKFVAEATDTTIVVDPAVKGKVKVVSSKPVDRKELYNLFLSILEVHGYTAVRSGGVVRVIQSKDARSAPVSVRDVRAGNGNDEYVTQVMKLENISAAKLIPVLRPLVPQQAHMAAYAPSNAIIISDIASNIDRISEIIQRMDRSAVQETDLIKLEYAVAEDVVRMLNQLNESEAQQGGGADTQVLLVADARTNSVLVSADELERARIKRLIQHLDTPLEQSGNVKVVYLEYAKADEIAEVLTRVMENITQLEPDDKRPQRSGKASTIEADPGTNALIITAATDEMAAIEAVIRRLDIRRAQVLVEAIIVEMRLQDGQDLGLQWLFANDSGAFGSNISGDSAQRIAGAVLPDGDDSDSDSPTTGDFNVGALAGALAQTPGATLGWGAVGDDLSMTVILNALRSQDNANILSTPSLLTLDNQEAFITVGENVPFVTGSYTDSGAGDGVNNPFQTIERQNVGITLTVTPHINEGNAVVLDIAQEVSSLSNASSVVEASDIITNERKLQTKVLAADGRVVVLGGLIKDDIQDGTQKVPLLGDIPFLGRLFRNDSELITKTNLLIFIRPTIIRDDEALAGATADKYRYIREQQELRRARGMMYLDDSSIPVLPEWQEQMEKLDEIREEQETAPAEAP